MPVKVKTTGWTKDATARSMRHKRKRITGFLYSSSDTGKKFASDVEFKHKGVKIVRERNLTTKHVQYKIYYGAASQRFETKEAAIARADEIARNRLAERNAVTASKRKAPAPKRAATVRKPKLTGANRIRRIMRKP